MGVVLIDQEIPTPPEAAEGDLELVFASLDVEFLEVDGDVGGGREVFDVDERLRRPMADDDSRRRLEDEVDGKHGVVKPYLGCPRVAGAVVVAAAFGDVLYQGYVRTRLTDPCRHKQN